MLDLDPVDGVRITILIDNLTDPLSVDRSGVARVNWPKALNGALPTAPGSSQPRDGRPDWDTHLRS